MLTKKKQGPAAAVPCFGMLVFARLIIVSRIKASQPPAYHTSRNFFGRGGAATVA